MSKEKGFEDCQKRRNCQNCQKLRCDDLTGSGKLPEAYWDTPGLKTGEDFKGLSRHDHVPLLRPGRSQESGENALKLHGLSKHRRGPSTSRYRFRPSKEYSGAALGMTAL